MPDKEFNKISFYVAAHADDWQLFMQPNAYNDLIAPGSKVVLIITTAGDAGIGEKYWRSREEGTKSSLRFCLAPLTDLIEINGTKEFNQHTINYWSANNTTCYFLRLPDGNLDGAGFSVNHYQSLSRFRNGQVSNISAVDDSATYRSWSDFYITLETIIRDESDELSSRWINYLNPDTGTNPDDHIDHITTGQAIQEMSILSKLRQALFVGYCTGNVPDNLSAEALFWKAGMFAVYEKAVYDGSGYSTLRESITTYRRWCLNHANFIIADSLV